MVIWIILALLGVWCFWLTLDGWGAGLGLKQIVELMDNQTARLNARVKALEDRLADECDFRALQQSRIKVLEDRTRFMGD